MEGGRGSWSLNALQTPPRTLTLCYSLLSILLLTFLVIILLLTPPLSAPPSSLLISIPPLSSASPLSHTHGKHTANTRKKRNQYNNQDLHSTLKYTPYRCTHFSFILLLIRVNYITPYKGGNAHADLAHYYHIQDKKNHVVSCCCGVTHPLLLTL